MTGAFLSFDLLFFYACFELTLIPLLFLIGGWGPGPNRRDAARKLFLYTLFGGLLTLIGFAGTVLYVYDRTGELTFSIPQLAELIDVHMKRADAAGQASWQHAQTYLFLAMAFGFAVKIPLVPLHTWLPGAYAEAPPAVTVFMSALLGKMGTFGLLRICLPLAPDATLAVGMPLIGFMGAFGIVYGAMCAYGQTDFRRLVAYSSISHLGFCALAVVAFNSFGIPAACCTWSTRRLDRGHVPRGRHADAAVRLGPDRGLRRAVVQVADADVLHDLRLSRHRRAARPEQLRERSADDGRADRHAQRPRRRPGVRGRRRLRHLPERLVHSDDGPPGLLRPLREPSPSAGEVKDLTGRERLAIGPLALLCLLLGVMAQPVLDVMKRDADRLAQVADDARSRVRVAE